MSKGIKVSKPGVDVKTAANKDLLISSQFDTLKVFRTGSLVLNLPTATLNQEEIEYTATFKHDLGYIPVALPVIGIGGVGGNAAPTEGEVWETGEYNVITPYIVNEIDEQLVNPGPWGAGIQHIAEEIRTEVDDEYLRLVITRVNYSMFPSDVDFTASQATLYYTIFHNRIDEEFNLLY